MLKNLNIQALAQEGATLTGTTPLQDLERLSHELQDVLADSSVNWRLHWELRAGVSGGQDVWLNLQAQAVLPLKCQRCMGTLHEPVDIDYWFRFVQTEAQALEQEESCEEDLLVVEPKFDAQALLEDELIMAQPLVALHDACPAPVLLTQESEIPHPFAVLAKLKK